MNKRQKNKRFYLNYIDTFNGKEKPVELLRKYIEDEKLIEHILFFEKLFPKYRAIIDEILAEGDKVFVRARIQGKHEGEVEGILATYKKFDTPFALGYTIRNEKIVGFWAIANEMEFFEQMGLAREQVEV